MKMKIHQYTRREDHELSMPLKILINSIGRDSSLGHVRPHAKPPLVYWEVPESLPQRVHGPLFEHCLPKMPRTPLVTRLALDDVS